LEDCQFNLKLVTVNNTCKVQHCCFNSYLLKIIINKIIRNMFGELDKSVKKTNTLLYYKENLNKKRKWTQ